MLYPTKPVNCVPTNNRTARSSHQLSQTAWRGGTLRVFPASQALHAGWRDVCKPAVSLFPISDLLPWVLDWSALEGTASELQWQRHAAVKFRSKEYESCKGNIEGARQGQGLHEPCA